MAGSVPIEMQLILPWTASAGMILLQKFMPKPYCAGFLLELNYVYHKCAWIWHKQNRKMAHPWLLHNGRKDPSASTERDSNLTVWLKKFKYKWDLREAPVTKILAVQMLLLGSTGLVKRRLWPVLSFILKNFEKGELSSATRSLFSAGFPFRICIISPAATGQTSSKDPSPREMETHTSKSADFYLHFLKKVML